MRCFNVAILEAGPPLLTTDGPSERDGRDASQVFKKPAVNRRAGSVCRNVRKVCARGLVALFHAVNDRSAFERDAAPQSVDPRVWNGEPRGDV
jgi:hypothetical protein